MNDKLYCGFSCPVITLCYCGQNPMRKPILSVCLVCLFFFFCCMICRCIYQIQLLFFLQKNSLSRTLRLLRSLTRGMMLSSCVTSSALRHPQLSGNTREPRFSRKKTVRGAISAIFAVTSLIFFLLFFQ